MPLSQTIPRFWHHFFVERLIFDDINIGNNLGEFLYSGKSLRPFLGGILETLSPLWILSGVTSNGTLSTN